MTKPPSGDQIFRGPSFEDAVSALLSAVGEPQPVSLLLGESGVGKTTVLHELMSVLRKRDYHTLFLEAAISEFLTPRQVSDRLSSELLDAGRPGSPSVMVVDAAERLSSEVIGYLDRLSTLRVGREPVVRLILAAQSSFQAEVETGRASGLARHIGRTVVLHPMERRESCSYVEHLCGRFAQPLGISISDQAARFLSQCSDGIPQKAERLLSDTLRVATRMGRERVTLQMVQKRALALGMVSAEPAAATVTDQPCPVSASPRLMAGASPSFPFDRALSPLPEQRSSLGPLAVVLIGISGLLLAGVVVGVIVVVTSVQSPRRPPLGSNSELVAPFKSAVAETASPGQFAQARRDQADSGPRAAQASKSLPPYLVSKEGNFGASAEARPDTASFDSSVIPRNLTQGAEEPTKAAASVPAVPRAAPRLAVPSQPVDTGPRKLAGRPMDPDLRAFLLQLGQTRLALGDVSGARLLLVRAAEGGSGEAATLVGKTYDPAYLSKVSATGIAPDVALAASWYRRGIELGDGKAAGWLGRLPRVNAAN